jgi:hypothetical protein
MDATRAGFRYPDGFAGGSPGGKRRDPSPPAGVSLHDSPSGAAHFPEERGHKHRAHSETRSEGKTSRSYFDSPAAASASIATPIATINTAPASTGAAFTPGSSGVTTVRLRADRYLRMSSGWPWPGGRPQHSAGPRPAATPAGPTRKLNTIRRVIAKPVLRWVLDLIAKPVPPGASPLFKHREEVLFRTGAQDLDGLLASFLADLNETRVADRASISPRISHATGPYLGPGFDPGDDSGPGGKPEL